MGSHSHREKAQQHGDFQFLHQRSRGKSGREIKRRRSCFGSTELYNSKTPSEHLLKGVFAYWKEEAFAVKGSISLFVAEDFSIIYGSS
jgi:hypothetical protein